MKLKSEVTFNIVIGEATLYWTKSRCAVNASIVNRDDAPQHYAFAS